MSSAQAPRVPPAILTTAPRRRVLGAGRPAMTSWVLKSPPARRDVQLPQQVRHSRALRTRPGACRKVASVPPCARCSWSTATSTRASVYQGSSNAVLPIHHIDTDAGLAPRHCAMVFLIEAERFEAPKHRGSEAMRASFRESLVTESCLSIVCMKRVRSAVCTCEVRDVVHWRASGPHSLTHCRRGARRQPWPRRRAHAHCPCPLPPGTGSHAGALATRRITSTRGSTCPDSKALIPFALSPTCLPRSSGTTGAAPDACVYDHLGSLPLYPPFLGHKKF